MSLSIPTISLSDVLNAVVLNNTTLLRIRIDVRKHIMLGQLNTSSIIEAELGTSVAVEGGLIGLDQFLTVEVRSVLTGETERRRRTLLMISAQYGAIEVLSYLLGSGSEPNLQSPDDGFTAMHCAFAGRSPRMSEAMALLLKHGTNPEIGDHQGRRPIDFINALQAEGIKPVGLVPRPGPSDLEKPEYCTDDFRMYSFKIAECPRVEEIHDWTECPFVHPGEKARRRDPRDVTYSGVACPDFRKGVCKRSDACPYAHGVFECWLHPSRYRTQMCKDGTACERKVCFFAHTLEELRTSANSLESIFTLGEDGQPEESVTPLSGSDPGAATSPRGPGALAPIATRGGGADPSQRASTEYDLPSLLPTVPEDHEPTPLLVSTPSFFGMKPLQVSLKPTQGASLAPASLFDMSPQMDERSSPGGSRSAPVPAQPGSSRGGSLSAPGPSGGGAPRRKPSLTGQQLGAEASMPSGSPGTSATDRGGAYPRGRKAPSSSSLLPDPRRASEAHRAASYQQALHFLQQQNAMLAAATAEYSNMILQQQGRASYSGGMSAFYPPQPVGMNAFVPPTMTRHSTPGSNSEPLMYGAGGPGFRAGAGFDLSSLGHALGGTAGGPMGFQGGMPMDAQSMQAAGVATALHAGPRQSSSTGLMGPSPEPGSIWGLGMGALMPMGMGGGEEQGGQARAMNPRLPM